MLYHHQSKLDMMRKHALQCVTMIEIVKEAAEIVGGIDKLAERLGCTRQALHQWSQVPRGRVLEIEDITGGKISRHRIRPDLFPVKNETAGAAA